jgi:large subunit ribosomal protein L9
MQVILLERMPNLGQMGELVTVKMGYARNFLFPKKKALRATKENVSFFEKQKVILEADNLKRKSEAEAMAVQMKTLTVTLIRTAGESGILYGSIRARDIADAVIASNYKIERSQVQLIKPIKHLGLHPVRVSLHPDVSFELTVNIAQSEEEAAVQQKLNQEESA